MGYTFIADRHPGNLDFSLLSTRGCSICNALAGQPHTFRCANERIARALDEPEDLSYLSVITNESGDANMITYDMNITVKLDGKRVGEIKQNAAGEFFYLPRGSAFSGPAYPTLEACKASLESED